MVFTITEKQIPQPEEVYTRLAAALGSAEVQFHPEAASSAKLLAILQEVITANSMISIDLEDVEKLLAHARYIHVVDWADTCKELTQLTAEAVQFLKAAVCDTASYDLLFCQQSLAEFEFSTLSDCIDILDSLGRENCTIITGDMGIGSNNRVFLARISHGA